MADSIYTKPLGINFRISTAPNSCIGNDTVFEFRREITFATRHMYLGEFRGTFSNKPNDSISIGLANFEKKNDIFYGRYAFINFPFYGVDTLFLKLGGLGVPNLNREFVVPSFNQELIYDLDITSPTINYVKSGGIIDMVFKGRLGASGKNEVQFICKQKLNASAPVTEIVFNGYQVRSYLNFINIP
jgi:hypothetical protein